MIRTIGFVLLALVIASVLALLVAARIAKKPGTVGAHGGQLAHCPASPNCVSSLPDEDVSHRVDPIPAGSDADKTLARLEAALLAMPRTTVVVRRPGYLHAESRSAFFGFVDDVELLAERGANVIHVRSIARVGYSDFGVNRARIEDLRAAVAD